MKRAWLLSTTSIQAVFIFAAALLRWSSTSTEVTSASALLTVALLAFAASGQTSLAFTVGLPELNTTMVAGAIVSQLPAVDFEYLQLISVLDRNFE